MSYVRYIDKTREYYLKQGYAESYSWAHYDTVPFARLEKPLSDCRVGLVTTSEIAVHYDEASEANPIVEEGFRSVYAVPADIPSEKLYSRTSSFDSHATHLDDINAFFPVDRMHEAVAAGRIDGIPERFCGAYNNYSQRKVIEEEGPKVLEFCRRDEVDAVILVPV